MILPGPMLTDAVALETFALSPKIAVLGLEPTGFTLLPRQVSNDGAGSMELSPPMWGRKQNQHLSRAQARLSAGFCKRGAPWRQPSSSTPLLKNQWLERSLRSAKPLIFLPPPQGGRKLLMAPRPSSARCANVVGLDPSTHDPRLAPAEASARFPSPHRGEGGRRASAGRVRGPGSSGLPTQD